jgi:hypothetical protein
MAVTRPLTPSKALHGAQADADGCGQGAAGPMRGMARRFGAGQAHNLGDDPGRKRSAAGLVRLAAQQTIDALLGVSRLPAPDRGSSPEDRSTAKTDAPAGDGQKQLAHAIAGEIERAERDAALSRISEQFRTRAAWRASSTSRSSVTPNAVRISSSITKAPISAVGPYNMYGDGGSMPLSPLSARGAPRSRLKRPYPSLRERDDTSGSSISHPEIASSESGRTVATHDAFCASRRVQVGLRAMFGTHFGRPMPPQLRMRVPA